MAIAIVLICLVIGSLAFHLLSPWYFTTIASNWGAIDDTIQLTFWITGAVFISINIFVAYCLIRYRARPGNKAAYQPENKRLEWWLIGITTIGIGVMLAPGLNIWARFVNVPADAAIVEVLGQQWHWQYRLPGKDEKLGAVDSKYITENNPFGMNERDPNGMDDILVSSQELHLPLNKPVKILLRSIDVLHNFAVPQFRVKMDLVPGLVTYIWVTPTRTGTFDLLCNELCGVAHFAMRGKIVVDDSTSYGKWLELQTTYAQKLAVPPTNIAIGKKIYATCATCHGSLGEGKFESHAPKLAGLGEWYLKRQLNYFKNGIRGSNDNDTYGKIMAPMAMILRDQEAIANVSAYIKSLPNNPAPTSLQGTAENGKSIFDSTCASCHGSTGEGIKLMHAPRLVGMSDWYLATQIRNFKLRYRGSHAEDQYGPQMTLMANMLQNDKSINDLLAYIAIIPNNKPMPTIKE